MNEPLVEFPASGMWCDDFDADLPKVVPDSRAALGETADVELITYSHETNGKINCPSAWWTDYGLTAFFATRGGGGPAPPGYVTNDKLVACTFWEAVRDEWIHDAAIVVNGRFVMKPLWGLMAALMYDLRGWTTLTDEARAATQAHVRAALRAAANRLRVVASPRGGETP